MISQVYKGSVYARNDKKPAYHSARQKPKKQKGFSKYGVNSKRIHQICRYHLGYSQRKDTSLFVLLAECLAKFGLHPAPNESVKAFAKSKISFIDSKTPRDTPAKKTEKPVKNYVVNAAPSVASDEFLQSFEWRRLRMQALKLHGARCQCCGASPSDGVRMNVDHIKPRKLFPELALDLDNLQVLCDECNHGKGNWDQTDWRVRQA